MSASKRIFKNTSFMLSSNVFKKLVTLIITLVIARYLGVEKFGQLSFAMSFVVLFSIFVDFGAKVLINREIARNKKLVNTYVSNVLILKFFSSAVMLILVHTLASLLSYSAETMILLYIASLIFISQSIGETFNSAFKAYERLKYISCSIVLQHVIKLVLAILIVLAGFGVKELLLAFLVAEFLGLLMRFIFYHCCIHKFAFEWNTEFSKKLVRKSLPFGVAGLMMVLYDKIDIAMLSKMVNEPDAAIGLYSAAYTLVFTFEFIPLSIGAAVYSVASIAYLKNLNKFKVIYQKLVTYFFYLTIPLCIGTVILAEDIIGLFYGAEYAPAVLALQILIWSTLLKFQMYSFGIVLNSMNKEKVTMLATILSLITNILLNIILIPKYSFIGASIATVIAELIYFAICFTVISLNLESFPLFRTTLKPAIASIVMGFVVFYTQTISFLLAIVVGMLIYCALMLILRAIPRNDLIKVKRFLTKM